MGVGLEPSAEGTVASGFVEPPPVLRNEPFFFLWAAPLSTARLLDELDGDSDGWDWERAPCSSVIESR